MKNQKIIIKWFLSLFSIIFTLTHTQAQQVTVRGLVHDTLEQPVAAATVWLSPLELGTQEVRTKTSDNGVYTFERIGPGTYLINVEAIGYQLFSDTLIIIGNGNQEVPPVFLHEQIALLDEVVVTARKPLIRQSGNTLTVDLSRSAAAAGVSVSDMIRRLPGISAGQDGQISIMGSERITVIIDGKPSYLPPSQLSNLLSGMSAATVEKIEVTTAATAADDANGSAASIRITTKKSSAEGFGVSAVTGLGRSYKNTFSTNTLTGNYRLGNANLYGTLDISSKHRFFLSKAESEIVYENEKLLYERISDRPIKTVFYTYQLGADWEIDSKHQLNASFDGYLDDWKLTSQSNAAMATPLGMAKYHTRSDIRVKEPYYYNTAHIGYEHRLDSTRKKITIAADYISFRNNSDGTMNSRISEAGTGNILENAAFEYSQPLYIDILSAKADAHFPIRAFAIKTGLKYAFSASDNPITNRVADGSSSATDDDQTGSYRYEEGIAAAYITAETKLAQMSITLGLRGEHTSAVQQDKNYQDRWNYFSLFPSFSASRPIADGHTLALSLSRRINRPSYTDLSPTRWFYDANYYTSGTPGLQPEFSWNAAFSYSLKEQYTFHINYSHRTNAIAYELKQENDGLIISRYTNYQYANRWEAGFTAPVINSNKLELTLSASGAFTEMPVPMAAGEAEVIGKFSGNVSLIQQAELPWDVTLETSAKYNTGELSGFYDMLPTFSFDGGLKKTFLNNSLTVNASFSDLFFTDRYRSESISTLVKYRLDSRLDSRRFFLTLTYNLGTLFKRTAEQSDEKERL